MSQIHRELSLNRSNEYIGVNNRSSLLISVLDNNFYINSVKKNLLPTSSPYIDNQQTLVYKWRSLTKHNKLYKCALYSIDFYRNQVKRLLLFSILIITTPTRATHVTFASFTNINIVAALQKATTPTIALVEKSTDTETNMLAVYFSSNKTGISCVSL